MAWIVDFFMTMTNIMSKDTNFPDVKRMRALAKEVAKVGPDDIEDKLTGPLLDTYYAARKWFHYQPGTFNDLSPSWFALLDAEWVRVFDMLKDTSEWEKKHRAYTTAIVNVLEMIGENYQRGEKPLAQRASARMLYYLIFLSGGIYLPTPYAFEKTVERLILTGPAIAQVSYSA